jgi:D-alanyl-D-alanine endopeptidase (penicillin-binding protein 7)
LVGLGLTALLLTLSALPERDANGLPHTRSESVLIRYSDTGEVILEKLADKARPIASLTKLMSALVLSKSGLSPPEEVTLLEEDKDRLKWSRSRLQIGRVFRGRDLYRAALIASDNRAMYALVRSLGYERSKFVDEMNALAKKLGMAKTQFKDPAGIDPENISTARDFSKLLDAVAEASEICETTTSTRTSMERDGEVVLRFSNTNRLLNSKRWHILAGKTGYTVEAGRNLAMRAMIGDRPVDMIFLGSREMQSIFGDAGRVKRWMEEKLARAAATP